MPCLTMTVIWMAMELPMKKFHMMLPVCTGRKMETMMRQKLLIWEPMNCPVYGMLTAMPAAVVMANPGVMLIRVCSLLLVPQPKKAMKYG